jgi:uncharacterized repeat protein (TIGR04076 family)
MYELKVSVTKVMGRCSADPPMEKGNHFLVRDGDIRIPEGGHICLWALQSLLPLITPKEREMDETKDDDWMWRVHHAQCPDPDGRVIYKIERVGKVDRNATEEILPQADLPPGEESEGDLRSLRVVVEEVKGKCTSGMRPGDHFILRSGRLYIPPGRHFCLYALHAVLPLLPAKQRGLQDDDWLKKADRIICPDPAGNVVLRIEPSP